MTVENKEQSFLEACRNHDLTFEMSDDPGYWRRGKESLNRIKELSNLLPPERAVEIWNKVVDEKLIPEVAKMFYWKYLNK